MCSGAIVLYRIPNVIAGENSNFLGAEDYLRANAINLRVLDDAECIQMMQEFIVANPGLWNEDIGI